MHCKSIKVGSVNSILSLLNSFDVNIKFTYELEHFGKLPFLDALLCRKRNKIYTAVYRKAPTMMYIPIGMHLHQLAGKEVHLRHL